MPVIVRQHHNMAVHCPLNEFLDYNFDDHHIDAEVGQENDREETEDDRPRNI